MLKQFIYLAFFTMINAILCFGQNYIPGNTYFSENGYIEYMAGNLPIVISAPHGGDMKPSTIPDRNCSGCVTINDSFTQELIREILEAIQEQTGCYPHIIINRLHRSKLDANRAVGEAAAGNADAENAWSAFHAFIDSAQTAITRRYTKGLYLDLHGHGHDIQRIELGYRISKQELQLNDDSLNTTSIIEKSSIKNLVEDNRNGFTHAELIRGASSLGSLLDNKSYPAVPSEEDLFPIGTEPYFRGGYNTERYGSSQGGTIDGIQAECHQDIRFNPASRKDFAEDFAEVIIHFLEMHYLDTMLEGSCATVSTKEEVLNPVYLFPNPADYWVFVSSDIEIEKLVFYSVYGQIVKIADRNIKNGKIDISELNPGMYLISFMNEDHIFRNSKLVISGRH